MKRTEMTTLTNRKIASQQIKVKKRLRWAPTGSESTIFPIQEIEENEIGSTWYNISEYKDFHKGCKNTVKLLKNYKNEDNFEFINEHVLCSRGIEGKLDKDIRRKQIFKRAAATRIVLEEQADQRRFAAYSADFLAELYQEACAQCRDEAYQRGLEDENEAKTCHEELTRREVTHTRAQTHVSPIKSVSPYHHSRTNGRSSMPQEMKPIVFMNARSA